MKELDEILNIEPVVTKPKAVVKSKAIVPEVLPPISKDNIPDAQEIDFDFARKNIKLLLIQGDEALDGILDLARQGEHPRAYEVAGQIIKTLVDANKDLMNLHKQKLDMNPKPKEEEKPTTQNINNTVYVGNTAELQKLLRHGPKEGT